MTAAPSALPSDETVSGGIWKPVVIAVGAMLVFQLLRNQVGRLDDATALVIPVALTALALSALLFRVTYKGLPDLYRVLARTTALGLLVYLVVEPPSFTLVNGDARSLAAFVDIGYWVALAAAIAALWRPSFMVAVGVYIMATRYVVEEISGFPLSVLDIKYMVEMGQFLALGACGLALARRHLKPDTLDLGQLALCLAFVAIGFHLGNYFWSGIAKLFLGPGVFTWALENQTQNLMLLADKRGVLPSGPLPGVTQALHDGLAAVVVPVNLFVFLTQLAAIIAVVRLGWLRALSLAYDALHIGIYVFGGLFFWPWIWNNVSIYLAAKKTTDEKLGAAPRICCTISILVGVAGALGDSARLAWWDVADVKIATLQAEAPSGEWVDVPVSWFMSHSYAVSHGYFDDAVTPGHYPPTIWGSALTYDRQQSSGTCPEPAPPEETETTEERAARLDRLQDFLTAHQARMADRGLWFYVRSHHHPSNPWMHRAFNSLDAGKIRRFRLVTQSLCLSFVGGQLQENVVKEDAVVFELQND